MSDKYGFFRFSILYLFVFLSFGYAAEERPIKFEIFPWHLEIEIVGVTDEAFREAFVSEGTSKWLEFSLPEGKYRYTARLDGFYNEDGVLSIPGPDENSSVMMTEKTQFASLLDTNSVIFGDNPLPFFVVLFSALVLGVSAVWGVVWRGIGSMWCDFAAYHREERWKKNPSPTSQELAIKNGVAFLVAASLGVAAYLIWLEIEPNPNTLSYEWRMIIAALVAIPLYNLVRAITLILQTLSVLHLRHIWGHVAQQLTEGLGNIWRYKQPYPRNYNYIAAKSAKTDKSYLIATDYANGTVSKDTSTQRFYGNTPKFSEQLAMWQRDLEKKRQEVKAEVALLFLPKAKPGKLGSVKTNDNVFSSGNVFIVCCSLDDLSECLEGIEVSNQKEVSPLEHGLEVEENAVKDLKNHKPNKHWKVRRGWLPYLGNIDARLVIPKRQDVVIEIKSYRLTPYVSNGELVRPGSKSMKEDVEQAKRNARRYRAKAVLWLPVADPFSFYFDGVLVCGGHALSLYRELGAPSSQGAGYLASVAP